MFFRVSQLPSEAAKVDADLFFAINNLVIAFRELKHLVWMRRQVCDYIKENFDFSEYDKRVMQAIYEKDAELGGFHKKLKKYIEIDLKDKFRQEYDEQNSCFYIGYGFFADSNFVQPSKIIVEAEFDFEMCKHATSTWLHKDSDYKKVFSYNFDFVNGGGGSSFKGYDRAIKDRNFFFCLLDGDKRHPLDKCGGTAGNVSKIPITNNRSHEVHILEATEMENIIPLKVMEEAIIKHANEEASKDHLLEMARSEHRLYFDHKKGLTMEKVLELEEKCGEYWINNKLYDEESEWLCRGFGHNIGDHCLEIMDTKSAVKNAESVCETRDSYWLFLGEQLFAWGVAFKRKVV